MNSNLFIDFDMIYDIDLGLFHMIKEKYNNSNFINTTFLEMSDISLIANLIERKEKNPLYLILDEKYKDNADSLLQQFLDQEYKDILSYSKKTQMYDLLLVYSKTGLLSINVLCKNVLEEQIIKDLKEKDTRIKFNIISNKLDVDKFDAIYLKDYKDVLKLKNLFGKHIYIASYNFNYEDSKRTLPLIEVSKKVCDVNTIYSIDIYNRNKYTILRG